MIAAGSGKKVGDIVCLASMPSSRLIHIQKLNTREAAVRGEKNRSKRRLKGAFRDNASGPRRVTNDSIIFIRP